MKKHFFIKVSGLVQGVFFRAATKEKAESLGIEGIVRNEPDGSVYIEAEGNDGDLQQFIQWCYRGPRHAQVEKCEITEGPVKNFQGFTISR